MTQSATTSGNFTSRVAEWLDRRSTVLIWSTLVITALLLVPLSLMGTPEPASQNPSGKVFDLQQRIDDTFAAPAHFAGFIAEAEDGDILTAESLSQLLLSETRLRAADERHELTPEGLESQEFLLTYFDNNVSQNVQGVVTIADAVEAFLQTSSNGELSLFEATDEEVKVALHHVLANLETAELAEFLSVQSTSETRVVNGQEIEWWVAPAVQFVVLADNERLGGGTQAVGVSADDRTIDKEEFNRNVQEVLREDIDSYSIWGIAIDANLESEDQGQESGVFITFTVIAAIVIVGIALRSYWAVALTGVGLGILMIWLKGFSLLFGLKSGLVIDLIVPIAMVSLGVDFAVHAVRRYQEERRFVAAPRRALVIGMAGVIPALVLAMLSDGIAFMANVSAGIEAVVHFGLAATVATASSFIVLGIVLPQVFARVDNMLAGRKYGSKWARASVILASFGAASAAGGSVILLIVVGPLAGAGFLAVTLLFGVALPMAYLKMNSVKGATSETTSAHSSRTEQADEPHVIDWLTHLTRYRYAVVVLVAGLTGAAAVFALRLDATFDVKDFFSSDSDFAVSLDKLDEHVGDRSGEPASVVIEGDFSDLSALASIQATYDSMEGNPTLGRDSQGVVSIAQPNLLQIIRDITASETARADVLELTGVEISEEAPYGFPQTHQQVDAVLDYAVQAGVPTETGELAYTPEDIKSVLFHNPFGDSLDLAQLTVFIPGTREQSNVERAKEALESDLRPLETAESITDYGVTGSPFTRQAQLEVTTESLQTSIPIAAAAAFLLLLVSFRSVRFAIVTIIPIGLVVVWLYAIMYLSGFALNFVTATIGAVSIGVGIDFSIHLTQRFREELSRCGTRFEAMKMALRGTGVALAGSSASSIVGFAIMGLAPMPLFSSYGFLTSIMVFLAVLAALVVLPSLLLIATPELKRTAAPEQAIEGTQSA